MEKIQECKDTWVCGGDAGKEKNMDDSPPPSICDSKETDEN